jgi:membrane associated rhomboid family serine protease
MIDSNTVTFMGLWFVLCLFDFPLLPKAANTVHAVGLGMGLLIGWLTPRKS